MVYGKFFELNLKDGENTSKKYSPDRFTMCLKSLPLRS